MSSSRGFTLAEAAERLTISMTTARKMVSDGQLQVVRIGRRLVVPEREIELVLAGAERSA
jgi:excisionase family DNA binding protein